MTVQATREQRRRLAKENEQWPVTLREVPRDQWPRQPDAMLRVLRSRLFLVQEYAAPFPAKARLSVCRTSRVGDRWEDGITWDELQQIKRECGYGDCDAVEVYPADADMVNVAAMRHLWVMDAPIPFAWRRA